MQKTLVYWRDIPSQVIIRRGRARGKAMLPARFQEAIDRAAMRAGRGGSEEYIADWRRETVTFQGGGDLAELAMIEAGQLAAGYDDERLKRLVASFGEEED